MKTLKLFKPAFLMLLSIVMFSCSDEPGHEIIDDDSFAIYIAKNPIVYNGATDYSAFNLDTVQLCETPFLTSLDIKGYDSVNHIINLKEPNVNLELPSTGVAGQMFVVTLFEQPVYCGFIWPVYSSLACTWITIDYPLGLLDGTSDKQIKINAGYPSESWFSGNDPRADRAIFDYFGSRYKLTGNTVAKGNGLNFYLVVRSANDTAQLDLYEPINALDLESQPFIAYSEIIKYDTAKNIMELSVNHAEIKNRIDGYGDQFVVSLDDDRQYSGLLLPITISRSFNDIITIIEPEYGLDHLTENQIKISLGYPDGIAFEGVDPRLTPAILQRLKEDNKIK